MIGQFFSIFINVISPVFGSVLIGFVAGPRLGLQARTLSRAAYFLFVPAFVFDVVSRTEIEMDLAARMIAYIFVVHVACALLGLAVARALGRSPEMIAAYVMIAVFGNIANFGLSLIRFRLGEAALIPGTVYFLTINIVAFAISVAAAGWAQGGKMKAVWSVLKTPAVLAFVPAAFFWVSSVQVPLFISRITGMLGEAMIPVMLIALGVQLAEMGLPQLNVDVGMASGVRLVGGPILAAFLVLPFGLTGLERGAGILQASMPPAVLTSIIAMEHKLVPEFVTSTLMFATLASLATLTVVLWLV